jgi:mannose-6-phosphate isomerase
MTAGSLIPLPANAPQSFYRGTNAIAAFRDVPDAFADPYHPEDWIASTTAQFGRSSAGLSELPDGTLLRDAIARDPSGWLGATHVEKYGSDPRLLVKLLDAGQRLPLHVHPDARFAQGHLGSAYGKTEAWIIIDAQPDAVVHLGFNRSVDAAQLAAWVETQQVDTMLAATNRIPVAAGDTVFVPAGLPHAIGSGILLAELQEPSDFSIFLEREGFDLDGPGDGRLGLAYDVALQCVNRSPVTRSRLDELESSRGANVFPAEADSFFRAERLVVDPSLVLDPAYSLLIVLAGNGTATSSDQPGSVALHKGQTILVPYGAGAVELAGEGLVLLRSRPPL